MFNVAEVRQDVYSGSRLSRGLPNRLQVGECSKLNDLNFSLQVSNIFKVWPGGKIRYKDYCQALNMDQTNARIASFSH